MNDLSRRDCRIGMVGDELMLFGTGIWNCQLT
jgi:hypothetical protein